MCSQETTSATFNVTVVGSLLCVCLSSLYPTPSFLHNFCNYGVPLCPERYPYQKHFWHCKVAHTWRLSNCRVLWTCWHEAPSLRPWLGRLQSVTHKRSEARFFFGPSPSLEWIGRPILPQPKLIADTPRNNLAFIFYIHSYGGGILRLPTEYLRLVWGCQLKGPTVCRMNEGLTSFTCYRRMAMLALFISPNSEFWYREFLATLRFVFFFFPPSIRHNKSGRWR